jgi:predicted RNase H-like nuclease
MKYDKKTKDGSAERIALLRRVFPEIDRHLANRPPRVRADDLLDVAAAAGTALRRYHQEAECVCSPEHDESGLEVTIYY